MLLSQVFILTPQDFCHFDTFFSSIVLLKNSLLNFCNAACSLFILFLSCTHLLCFRKFPEKQQKIQKVWQVALDDHIGPGQPQGLGWGVGSTHSGTGLRRQAATGQDNRRALGFQVTVLRWLSG